MQNLDNPNSTPCRVIVCGGRDYGDREAVFSALDRLNAKRGINQIIHGGAMGADYLAYLWARDRNVPWRVFPAEWDRHGRRAGPIRNQQMLNEGEPSGVVAFPGGRGTLDMISRARRAGVTVWEPCK